MDSLVLIKFQYEFRFKDYFTTDAGQRSTWMAGSHFSFTIPIYFVFFLNGQVPYLDNAIIMFHQLVSLFFHDTGEDDAHRRFKLQTWMPVILWFMIPPVKSKNDYITCDHFSSCIFFMGYFTIGRLV